jgi:hypothetical protein
MRKTSIFFVFALALLHSPGETQAAGKAVCDAYVEAAVKAAQEVRDRGCGGRNPSDPSDGSLDLNHSQWTLDPNGHRRWCMSASEENVNEETARRNAQLNQCRLCDPYSTDAAKKGKEASDLFCGFDLKHPHWSTDRQTHMRWCMASRPETMEGETKNRDEMIGLCRDCQPYGKVAREQALEAEKLKCRGLDGARWSTSKADHVKWCIGERMRVAGRTDEAINTSVEEGTRDAGLAACKREAKATQGLRKGAAGAALFTAVPRKKEKAATKPVHAARKPAEQPYAAKQKVPSSGGGSSAMDRLGGGSPGGTGSSGAASAAKPRGGSSAAAPASSATGGGGGGGGGAAATTINRNAIGGGGSPERIR